MDQKALQNFYEFDDTDLEANRSGRLTEKQLTVVKNVSNERKVIGYAAGGFFIVVALLGLLMLLIALIVDLLSNKLFQPATFGPLLAVLVSILMAGGVGGFIMMRLLKKANAKYVLRSTEGPVKLKVLNVRSRGARSYKEYQMQIGSETFVLDDELVGHIKEGDTYAVYFLDYQDGSEGIIQSMEKQS